MVKAPASTMFRVIEDIGNATFDEGVPWTWETFGDYLDHIRTGLGINVGALVGHATGRTKASNRQRQYQEEENLQAPSEPPSLEEPEPSLADIDHDDEPGRAKTSRPSRDCLRDRSPLVALPTAR